MLKNGSADTNTPLLWWDLTKPPVNHQGSPLVILCGDWSYGLIPHCGPGPAPELWKNEECFLDGFSSYLTAHGISTLRLSAPGYQEAFLTSQILTDISRPDQIMRALHSLQSQSAQSFDHIFFFGHGLGGHVACLLAAAGHRPAGFIFAGSVYADYETVLTQKYYSLLQTEGPDDQPLLTKTDLHSAIISKNLGTILHAARKGRKKVRIHDPLGILDLPLTPSLCTGDEIPRDMFRYVTSPTLVIHGTSDLDISVWNAASIEQSVRQQVVAPIRHLMTDRDHWFRPVPAGLMAPAHERVLGTCFRRETDEAFYKYCLSFIMDAVKKGGKRY